MDTEPRNDYGNKHDYINLDDTDCICSESERHSSPSVHQQNLAPNWGVPDPDPDPDHNVIVDEDYRSGQDSESQARSPAADDNPVPTQRVFHELLNGKLVGTTNDHLLLKFLSTGRPCDKDGNYLPSDAPPEQPRSAGDDWSPFCNRLEFETADFLFRQNQMSSGDINVLLDLWAASLVEHGGHPPFADHRDLHGTLDAISYGDVPWKSFSTTYSGDLPADDIPTWMTAEYDVWFRDPRLVVQNMLSNPDFRDGFDNAPYQDFDKNGDRRFGDFFSGDWVWKQAVGLF